jgi:CheY-like chemotaxis protein
VYTNLILNAVDAMPDGGDLMLRCSATGGRVRSEVEDTGSGMPEETRRHLFDPFFTTKGHSGTGLGMSVAYGIVTRHDGTIEVASRLGAGTRFSIEFPACAAGVEVEQVDVAAKPRQTSVGRILVIDDEAPIAQLLEDALGGVGHTVEIAGSGREGLDLAARSEFDLVMTDLGMPDMSGWEVATKIRSERPDTPVILVTGWGSTLSPEDVQRCGISAVVHKPFEIQEVIDTANAVLGGRRVAATRRG